jgi:hypothetical protein
MFSIVWMCLCIERTGQERRGQDGRAVHWMIGSSVSRTLRILTRQLARLTLALEPTIALLSHTRMGSSARVSE